MLQAKEFYEQQLARFISKKEQIRKQMLFLSIGRLLSFLGIIIAIYCFFGQWNYMLFVTLPLLIAFIVLLQKYTQKKKEEQYAKQRIHINKLELLALEGEYSAFATGKKYKDPKHAYSEDIDLFGQRSFFQYLTRCHTSQGEAYLASLLKSNDIKNVSEKQNLIKELTDRPNWRQDYMTTTSLMDPTFDLPNLLSWLENYKGFTKFYFKWLPKVYGVISIIWVLLLSQGIVSAYVFGGWLILGIMISNRYQKGISNLTLNLSKHHELLSHYAQLLARIEQQKFSSQLLLQEQAKLKTSHNTKASQEIAYLSRKLQNLEHGGNLFVKIFGNGLFLYELWTSYPVEKWLEAHTDRIKDWIQTTAFFEAQISLSNFAYNHPRYTYPKLDTSKAIFKAQSLCHPLLLQNQAVSSDVNIHDSEFLIITGANMAGKSTFLRSVSLAIVMSNMGMPIRAEKAQYRPIPLLTSMRTTDSLDEETSYFFAELKRLRFIVDHLEDHKCFIILDEILKGTNSTDKADGSIRFVKKMVAMQATGLIATHDLSLCELENELPQIRNYFFDTQIQKDELYFDYKLKPGICSDRNATFLLEKMKIIE